MRGKGIGRLCAAVGVAALMVVAAAAPASAHGGDGDGGRHGWDRDRDGHHGWEGGKPTLNPPIAEGIIGPLQFEVSDWGKVLVGQSFAGTVTTIGRDGTREDLFTEPGVDGVSFGAWGTVIYTHTDFEAGITELRVRTRSGAIKTVADLRTHEVTQNPDGSQTYGLQGLTPECAAMLPPDAGLLPYQGIVDSHPYAVTPVWGGWLVAEAGGNDILHVSWRGKVRTVAVLPPQEPVTVTAEAAAANELPGCIAGSQFVTEPVPTDIEVGREGLYVSTLPGGPEDPSFGARGSVYRISRWSGRVSQVATGFAGAANLAISPRGTIYVSELFGNRVSKVVDGQPELVAEVPSPSGLEWSRGKLYVGTNSMTAGAIQTITFG